MIVSGGVSCLLLAAETEEAGCSLSLSPFPALGRRCRFSRTPPRHQLVTFTAVNTTQLQHFVDTLCSPPPTTLQLYESCLVMSRNRSGSNLRSPSNWIRPRTTLYRWSTSPNVTVRAQCIPSAPLRSRDGTNGTACRHQRRLSHTGCNQGTATCISR
jgi:hypothetical protein